MVPVPGWASVFGRGSGASAWTGRSPRVARRWGSDALALRARQLSRQPVRADVATRLRQVVEDAAQPQSVLMAVSQRRSRSLVTLCQAEVLEWREGVLGLAERLQGDAPINPCGVARARVLLNDGSGPLYNPDSWQSLGEMIWWVADGLEVSGSARGSVLTHF